MPLLGQPDRVRPPTVWWPAERTGSQTALVVVKDRYQALDWLATPVAVVAANGRLLFVNAALEDGLGLSRRSATGTYLADFFTDPGQFLNALAMAKTNELTALRCDAWLRCQHREPMHVQVVVAQTEVRGEVVVELLPLEQQIRQDREERLIGQANATKELIRNLAHEIKNPLGGIRGAAQLLQMELNSRELIEYTQVIIHEADRLQTLVDRLLAPHRNPQVLGDVNIHEVCERVRSVILAEFAAGLRFVRDYDVSLPEFRGDREQLIQAVLNIAHNAALALVPRMASGSACLTFKTRVARQVTLGKQRHRLALELHVIDNGPGVPEGIKDRIFFPLVSGREGGHGLGLTLAHTFVQQHQGLIECDSAPGRTHFKILIPLP